MQLMVLACIVALLIALNSASLRSGQARIVNRLASVAGPALDSAQLAEVHGEQPSPRRASETSPYGSASSLLDAISRPATVRGPVKKEGMLDLRNWHVKRSRIRQEALDAWRERRMQLESEARALQEEQAGSSSTGAWCGSSAGHAAAARRMLLGCRAVPWGVGAMRPAARPCCCSCDCRRFVLIPCVAWLLVTEGSVPMQHANKRSCNFE